MRSPRLLSRLASVFTTPLAPADFLRLVDPLASARQLRGIVTAVEPAASGSATIRFRPGRGWSAHRAGQWARVGVEIDGVRHWRSYSLSAAAGEDPAITVTDVGRVSHALVRETRPGDVLFLAPPEGRFVLPEHPRPLFMLTAGSGLTPVRAMVATLVPRRPDADVVLLHVARSRADALFVEELSDLSARFPGLRVVWWFTADRGRRPDLSGPADLDRVCPDWRTRAAYACGPSALLDAAEALWAREGVELRVERFGGPAIAAGGSGGRITFERSDREVDADATTTLLAAGEGAGVLLPSGCRMGLCHSCLTPLVAGQVRDTRTGAVHGEPGHLVQTCVSTAAGPVSLDV